MLWWWLLELAFLHFFSLCVRFRVPTQIAFSNSLSFPCFFPCSNLCNVWLLYTQNWLGRYIQLLKRNRKFLRWISQYPLPFESGNFQLEQTKLPVFWQSFQILCISLTGNIFGHFPCVPCAVGTLPLNLFRYWWCVQFVWPEWCTPHLRLGSIWHLSFTPTHSELVYDLMTKAYTLGADW